MDLIVPKKALRRLVATVHGTKRQTDSVFDHVQLETLDGVLQVTTADTAWSASGSTVAEVSRAGRIAVKAAMLLAVLDNLADGPVRVTVEPHHDLMAIRLVGHSATTTLQASSVGFSTTHALEGDTMIGPAPVPLEPFARLLSRVRRAMSKDMTRPYLNGLLLKHVGEVLCAWATDGHRAHRAEMAVPGLPRFPSMLVPYGAVVKLRSLLAPERGSEGHALVATDFGKHARFVVAGTTLDLTLCDMHFPPCETVIPERHDYRIIVKRSALLASLRAVAALFEADPGRYVNGGGDNWSATLALDGNTMRIRSSGVGGSVEDEVPVSYDGPAVTRKYSARILLDAVLSVDADEVVLETEQEDFAPLVVRAAGAKANSALALMMPMRS